MKLALFILAAILGMTWILGCFVFSAGAIIHICFISGGLALIQGIILTPRSRVGPELDQRFAQQS